MARLGVVGLGNIGGAVARNLVADGHEVVVTDVDPERAAAVAGATAAAGVPEVAAESAVTLLSLPTPEVVAAVADEWAAHAHPGSILVDLSTSAPAGNQALAARLEASGHHFVEAPLTGGAVGAEHRALVFMLGGDDAAVAQVQPILEPLGRAVFHLGPVGTGSTMKLVNSLLAFACTWASLEGLALARAAGIPVPTAVEVVRTGGATNFYVDRGVEGLDRRDGPARFSLGLAAKDAALVREAADAAGVSGAVAAAMVEVLDDAVGRGLGDKDWADLVQAVEARSGVRLSWAEEGA